MHAKQEELPKLAHVLSFIMCTIVQCYYNDHHAWLGHQVAEENIVSVVGMI